MGIKVMRENENFLIREVILPKTSFYLKKFNNQKAKNGTSFKESIKLLRASINFAIKINANTFALYQTRTAII